MLKLYIVLFCPICYCPCPSCGSVLLKLCSAQAVHSSVLSDLLLSCPSCGSVFCSSCKQFCSVRSVIVLSKLWFCTAQAVHSSVLSDLLLSCPSCGSVLLKLYIVLFCPICYCLVQAVVLYCSSCTQFCSVRSVIVRPSYGCAQAVLGLFCPMLALNCTFICSVRSGIVLSKLWFCNAQAVHRSVLSDLLLSCPSCGSVLLKLYIYLFCPICYCLVQAVVLYCSSCTQLFCPVLSCGSQAVHRSVLSDLLLSCPSCGSVLLKLYIVLFCPICYCLVQAVVLYCSSCTQLCSVRSVIVLSKLWF